MGRYVPRSGWAEQKTSRESCCGKTAVHHTCQPEFRRAKNCSFALRRLGQNREAKRVRRSLPVSRQSVGNLVCEVQIAFLVGPSTNRSSSEGVRFQKPYSLAGFSTKIVFRTFSFGAHTGSWLNRRPSSIWSSGAVSIERRPGTRDESGWGQSVPHRMR